MPNPGDETPRKAPFTPYDPGPPEALWHYEVLTPEEKAVVDRGRNRPNAAAMHGAFDQAVRESASRARAEAAANQLQATHMETIGVVP